MRFATSSPRITHTRYALVCCIMLLTLSGCGESTTPPKLTVPPVQNTQANTEQIQRRDAFVDELAAKELGTNEYRSLQRDLDGDNVPETITLQVRPYNEYEIITTLTINTSSVTVAGHNPQGHFGIVDIDTKDKQLEIAISDDGPSSDYTTSVYTYDGERIIFIGTISGNYSDMIFDGSGQLTTQTRAHILDTWFYDDEFMLSKNQLVNVPKKIYTRNMPPVTVLQVLPLLESPTEEAPVAYTLQKGNVVHIVGCDNVAWCVVENQDGLRGWFRQDPWSADGSQKRVTHVEYFDGLSNAD